MNKKQQPSKQQRSPRDGASQRAAWAARKARAAEGERAIADLAELRAKYQRLLYRAAGLPPLHDPLTAHAYADLCGPGLEEARQMARRLKRIIEAQGITLAIGGECDWLFTD